MSDNRTLAKGMMIGGAPVYNNVESTTDTTMPSTSFFKTEDVDGKPVIISRDNIMGIVKDCLGSILNGLTDQTTVTKVPTLNGNTLGASAVSTLASVLGGVRVTEKANITDLDYELGIVNRLTLYFAIPSQSPANLPSDISTSTRFFLEIINASEADVIQRVTSRGSNVTYQRTYSTSSRVWTPWIQL